MPSRDSRRAPARAGCPTRRGFTLVEILVVVVIIGILAAVAIARFGTTTAKADLATVKADLHSVVLAQENYFAEHAGYAPSLALLDIRPSPQVNVTIVEATAAGYSAQAVHPAAVPVTCAVYYGQATPLAPATQEGTLACR